jgi:gliding motility-associated-like protein
MLNRNTLLSRLGVFLLVYASGAMSAFGQQSFFDFTPPPQNVFVDANCEGSVSDAPAPVVTATSPGAVVTTSQMDVAASGFGPNTVFFAPDVITVTWFVADNQGHSATFTFNLFFLDNTPPVFDVSGAPSLLIFNSVIEVPAQVALPVTDNCSNAGQITQNFTQTTPPPICSSGVFSRIWQATDQYGNITTYTQQIEILQDLAEPVITIPPANGTADCATLPGGYQAWLAAQMAAFTATDPSGIDYYNNNAPASLGVCPAPVTVQFRAYDGCGLYSFVNRTFTPSVDSAPPTIVQAPRDTVVYCGPNQLQQLGQWIQARGYANVTDACSPQFDWTMFINGSPVDSLGVQAALQASFSNPCSTQLIGSQFVPKVRGKVVVNFYVSDACDNEQYAGLATFVVSDTTAPVISNPALLTEECGGGNDAAILQNWINNYGNATVSDACSSTSWLNFSYTTSDGQSGTGNFGVGPYPTIQTGNCNWFTDVTFRASDQCGNIGQRTLRFRIGDVTPPVIGFVTDTIFIYCPTPVPSSFGASVSDNCATGLSATYTQQYADTICTGNYSLRLRWTATDLCGNSTVRTQIVAIRDTIGPVFGLVPAPITVNCQSVNTIPNPIIGTTVTATDPCGALQGITWIDTNNKNPNPNTCGHYNYQITRRFIATDVCGNTRTATQAITVQDVQAPTSAVPLADTLILCQNLPLTPAVPVAVDQCSPVLAPVTQVSQTIVAGNCADNYTIAVTWNATDVCGNIGAISRNFLVRDTIRPALANIPADITVDCGSIPAPPPISSLPKSDNCDAAPVVTLQVVEMRDPILTNCAHWSNYQIIRRWTVTDACSNSRTYTQTISVMDNTGPELSLRDTILLPATLGQCGVNLMPPTPLSVFDQCSSLPVAAILRDTTPITGPPSSTAVCDTVFMVMAAPNLPPQQPVMSGTTNLVIHIDNADAGGPEEYFRVYGENGVLLGITTPTVPNIGCGSGSTTLPVTAQQLNNWLADGQLRLTLAPNGIGESAINPICSGRQVRAEVSYQYITQQVPVTLQYSINNGPLAAYPAASPTFLAVGTHTIRYVATDCAGNTSSASSVIRIDDVEPPVLNIPTQPTYFTGANNCEATVTLPFPGITENCNVSGQLNLSSAVQNTLFVVNDNAGLVPQNITLTVAGLIPNAITGGVLRIRHRGDHGQSGEFFQVFDENNNPLSTTQVSTPGVECSQNFNVTTINITSGQLNTWGANGTAQFRLVANTDALNFNDWINPCGPVTANWDGISTVQAELEYRYAIVQYAINGGTPATINGQQTSVVLPAGTHSIRYTTNDAAGNTNIADFNVVVRDTIRPDARCQNRTIFTSVTGANPVTLTVADINNGSTDNCSGTALMYTLSQTTFTCAQSGQIIPVTLTVTDTSGNSKNCVAQVRVETETIPASATANICEGGTAQLFCTPPGDPANYTYQWTSPAGAVFALVQNPMIPNAQLNQEGAYTVRVIGPTGCSATGVVNLELIGLPFQPVLSTPLSLVCAGQNVQLSTNAYSGIDVTYEWYRTDINQLLGVTIQPNFTVMTPAVGPHNYLVRIVDQDCASALSAVVTVLVQARPAATVAASSITLCAGEPVVLSCTTPSGPGVTYAWAGPNGFVSNLAQPLVFNATTMSAGTYTVTVTANGCAGTPAQVALTVKPRPSAPAITGTFQVCERASVTLTAQPPVGSTFGWISPDLDTTNSTLNSLVINNIMVADSGLWRVYAVLNGCTSLVSPPKLVEVQPYPNVIAEGNTPLCQGTSLSLVADVDLPASMLSFNWAGPNGYSSFMQNPVLATPATGDYIVSVQTSFGCADRDTLGVEFVPLPIITSITSNAPSCVSDTTDVTLFNTVVSPNGPFTYTWTYPNGTNSSLANLLITNASAADNGDYQLVVTDKYGCASQPYTYNLDIEVIPPLPIIAQPSAVCSGAPLTLLVSNASDFTNLSATFLWEVNNQPNATNTPSLSFPSSNTQLTGSATVRVVVGNCLSAESAPVNVTVYPQPIAPPVVTNSPVCEGDTLFFTPNLPPGTVVDSWEWQGPAAFQASIGNPIRYPSQQSFEGEYQVRITVNGCVSAFGEPIAVEVKPRPQRPTAQFDAPVCLEQMDTLTLRIAPGTQTNGAEYQWYQFPAQVPLDTPSFATAYQLTDFSQQMPGNNGFYVFAILDGCRSERSFNIAVKFDTIPDEQANAGNNFLACAGLDITLNAIPPTQSGLTGRWAQAGGPPVTLQQPNSPNSMIDGDQIGANNQYQFVWTLSNGACNNYDTDTLTINSLAPAPAQARADFDTCFASVLQLNAQQDPITPGIWTQPPGQSALNITITDPTNPNTTVTNIPQGATNLFYFTWVVNSAACGTSTDEVVVRNISTQPVLGSDIVVCSESDCVVLQASALGQFETGFWTTNEPGLAIASPGSIVTQACGFEPGISTFIFETNNGLCGARSRDTVRVEFQSAPVAFDDIYTFPFGTQVQINVLLNDVIPASFDVNVIDLPNNGQLQVVSEGVFTYLPGISFDGTDQLLYQVCNLNCRDTAQVRCDIATVLLNVNGPTDCEVPTLFTPNNDFVNDVFFVPCLECADCPQDNRVTIFNQWGDQVFTQSPYGQNWDGTFNGEPLPTGTYFWVLDRTANGQTTSQRGFVIIQR